MFQRILIANRAEIACRIARTCGRLGVEFVAVHSSAEADALHLQGAAASVCLGGGPASESYLNADKIIAAALAHGCDAVHPGYGFLSENAGFASAVAQAGLTFIGPRADTIAALGDKARAKALMGAAGVPTVPGFGEASDDPVRIEEMIQATGFPALLKPSAGGGGKGMQMVANNQGLREAVQSAIRVARNSFGDGRLIVERFIEQPRHVEVQIFGDMHGNIVHLFERECSLQRRHQKVIEEAPAIGLDPSVRQHLLNAAVRGARSIGYLNAGTFEFILGPDQRFYFLEVNTRLQVEHPVTEAITGLDLVEWQLRVAAGEPLPLTQEQIRTSGHAIECRVYAEDPAHDFRPEPGCVGKLVWPRGIRVEAGIAAGGSVPPFYDPMVAKLVAHGDSRPQALARMSEALSTTVLTGLTTNLGYLGRLLADPGVQAGEIHTRYLDEHNARLAPAGDARRALACAATLALPQAHPPWPWAPAQGACTLERTNLDPNAPFGKPHFWLGDQLMGCALHACNNNGFTVLVEQARFQVRATSVDTGLTLGEINDQHWAATDAPGGSIEVQVGGDRIHLKRMHAREFQQTNPSGSALAPMPGIVALLPVAVDTPVTAGTVLAIVEAMKMENRVIADVDGVVKAIRFSVGDTVKAGDLLVEINPCDLSEQDRGAMAPK